MINHTSDGFPENSRGRFVMLDGSSGVVQHSDMNEFSESHASSEEGAGENKFLGSDDNDSLSKLKLFGKVGGKSTENVSLGINDNLLFEHLSFFFFLFCLYEKNAFKYINIKLLLYMFSIPFLF